MAGVGVSFPGRPDVLANVNLRVAAGEVAVVQGRSGSGKSTLLAVAAGLQEPHAGAVRILGEAMDATRASAAALRRKHVGIVFQHLNLLAELSVAENVALPLRLRRFPARQRDARVNELLHRFGLTDLAHRRPGTLSGGEQQRVAIARALAPGPRLLLVDEPTSSLDDANARTVAAALGQAAQLGAAVLVSTHDPLMASVGTRYRIVAGRLVRDGERKAQTVTAEPVQEP